MRNALGIAAAAMMSIAGTGAFAWGDMYMGDGTNNPNSNVLVHSYNAPNYCPQGLQPVMMGGVICCGEPNAGPYIDRAGKVHRKPAAKRYYTPAGEKGVVYR